MSASSVSSRVKRRLQSDLEAEADGSTDVSPRRSSRTTRSKTPDRLGFSDGLPAPSKAAVAEKRSRKLLVALKNPGSFQQPPTPDAPVDAKTRALIASVEAARQSTPPAAVAAAAAGSIDQDTAGPSTLQKRDNLQQRIKAKLDLSDWTIGAAFKDLTTSSPLRSSSDQEPTDQNADQAAINREGWVVAAAVAGLVMALWLFLDYWLPVASEVSSTAQLVLLSVPDVPAMAYRWLFYGGAGPDDFVQQMARQGASFSPATAGDEDSQDFSMDKMIDALVKSSKFEEFVSRVASSSVQDSTSRLQKLVAKYEADVASRLDSIKKLNDLEKDKFRSDFDRFKANFDQHVQDMDNHKLPSLHRRVEELTSSNQDVSSLVQRRLQSLASEIGSTQQQIHDLKVSRIDQAGDSGSLKMEALEQKLATLTSDFEGLTTSLRDCQGKPDVSFQEIGENLSKVLRQELVEGGSSADQFPETHRLVTTLKEEFVAGATVQGKVDEAAQAIKDEIATKVQAEVLSSEALQSHIQSVVAQQAALASTADMEKPASFSREDLAEIVARKLVTYDADKTGLFDFALESAGGTVETVRCTKTYSTTSAVYTVFGVPVWSEGSEPGMVLRPNTSPGQCWAFHGSSGTIVIRLSSPVVVEALTVEHIPPALSPNGNVTSAPRDIAVYGLHSLESEARLLANVAYKVDPDSDPIQTFAVTSHPPEAFPLVEVKVQSNHGNPDYTCLYRIRVHGNILSDGQSPA